MDEPGFASAMLHGRKVAVWGLGLMGGSLAMALRGQGIDVVGIDSSSAVTAAAVERRAVTAASTHPDAVLEGADLIVLAAPISAILSIMPDLPRYCPRGAVVIDLGSTKRKIVAALEALPKEFSAVGGHPMCGKEISGFAEADPLIYQNAPFALVETDLTTPEAREIAVALAKTIGACPLWIDADTHDRWVAATSQVPFLVASALAGATAEDAAPLVGTGFRSTTRLAAGGSGSTSHMMIDILRTNADHIRPALAETCRALQSLERLLETDRFDLLAGQLEQNARQYRRLTDPRSQEIKE